MMSEVWREIPRCFGYFASSLGRIKGPRKIYDGHIDPKGYIRVSVLQDGKRVYRNVARLVAAAFYGENSAMVLHINGNPADNRPENLRYGTAKENYQDAIRHGTNSKGNIHGRSILTDKQVAEIKRDYRPNIFGYDKLGKKYGVSKHTVKLIIKGVNWAHVQAATHNISKKGG